MGQKFVTSRARLERAHGHGEKAASTINAIGLVVGGAVTLIGGLRALIDIVAPMPEEPNEG